MKRQALVDGGWFDADASVEIKEGTRWDGNNHVSLATGSQWDHEVLHVTKKGRFVVNHWSQWQGSGETYVEITPAEAAQWLVANERDEDELPPTRVKGESFLVLGVFGEVLDP